MEGGVPVNHLEYEEEPSLDRVIADLKTNGSAASEAE